MITSSGESPGWMQRVLLGLLFLATLLAACEASAEGRDDRVVLVLNSYHKGYSWSDNEMDGIYQVFRNATRRYDLRMEYLDTKHFPRKELFFQQKELLARKYPPHQVSLLLVADNPALEFALLFRDELFPGAAIVFCGIDGFSPAMIAGGRKVTGVAERVDIRRTIETALTLHPETREIFVIHDYTSTGLATRREAEADLKNLSPRVNIRFMDDVGTDAMLGQVQALPANSLILALSYSRDRDGVVYDHPEIAGLLAKYATVPIYGAHEERLGNGVVGGSLLGGRLQGSSAAAIALRILEGEAPESIPVVIRSPSRLMFDYRQLQRLAIPLKSLPPESIIVNEPESFYRMHTVLVWAIVTATVTLLSIIAILATTGAQKRRSTRQLLEKADELQRKNRELEQFNVLAYHNLQEPLRSISGFLQLLERKYRDRLDAEGREYIGLAVQGVFRMKQLFTDFLEYTAQVRHDDEVGVVDLGRVLVQVVSSLSREITACGANVVGDDLPEVVGNERQLHSLFRHLLSNSIKFRGLEHPEIRITSRLTDEFAELTVTDNGIGIDAEYREKVFDIFERLHHSDRYEGTGVGLAICRRIVSLHDGRIWLEAGPGGGTAFHFTLKRARLARVVAT